MVEIYLGDCLEVMSRLETGSVDFLFTDLPYGSTRCKWDTPIDLAKFWKEANRVVKKNGAKVLFAQTPFDKILGYSNLRQLRYEWIWEKTHATGHLNAKFMPMKAHENLLVFYDKTPTYNPQMTHGHQPSHTNTKRVEVQNRTGIYGKCSKEVRGGGKTSRYPRTVLRGPSDKQNCHLHQTQKPLWLCEEMVLTYTNPGQLVLDTCMGSASSGVACQNTGRRYIGIEIDPESYGKAKARLEKNCKSKKSGRVIEAGGKYETA